MIDIAKRVRDIFVDAQRPMQARTKLVSRLQKVAESCTSNTEVSFFKVFTHCVKHSLVVFTREPAVERTIDFVVAFATAGQKADTLNRKQVGEIVTFDKIFFCTDSRPIVLVSTWELRVVSNSFCN